MNIQGSWRFCQKCDALFYDGRQDQGVCSAGDGHSPEGFSFFLPFNTPANGNAQGSWRFCEKCYVMFYAGHASQGVCAAGSWHSAHGDDFVLPHGNPETSSAQASWRYCQKCSSMFYTGGPNQGVCPDGGTHSAHGDDFVLFHGIPQITQFFPLVDFNDNEDTTLGVLGEGFYPGGTVEMIMQLPGDSPVGSPIIAVADSAGKVDAAALLIGTSPGSPPGWGYPGVATVSQFQVGAFYEITEVPTEPVVAAANATWTGDGISGFAQGGY